jgi:hypothetical protein
LPLGSMNCVAKMINYAEIRLKVHE